MNAHELKKILTGKSPTEILERLSAMYDADKLVFATSLGAEDQVITHFIVEAGRKIRIFTLNTGRLHQETVELIDQTNSRYGIQIEVYSPDQKRVKEMVAEKGADLFYDSVEERKKCCGVRKLEPLKRALKGAEIWITGLRRGQAATRDSVELIEVDDTNGLIKVNLLFDWSTEAVWDFIKANKIPYNPLHDQGFPSIGCEPCTRAVKAGEDIRAGRWWWENPDHRECGLHRKK